MENEVKLPKNCRPLDEELTYEGGLSKGGIAGVIAAALVVGGCIGGLTAWGILRRGGGAPAAAAGVDMAVQTDPIPAPANPDVWFSTDMNMMVTRSQEAANRYMSVCKRPITSTIYSNGVMVEEMGSSFSIFVLR